MAISDDRPPDRDDRDALDDPEDPVRTDGSGDPDDAEEGPDWEAVPGDEEGEAGGESGAESDAEAEADEADREGDGSATEAGEAEADEPGEEADEAEGEIPETETGETEADETEEVDAGSPGREVGPSPEEMATGADEAEGDVETGSGPLGAVTDTYAAGALSEEPWYRRYLWDHQVHAVVIALFAAYPFAYAYLTDLLPATMTTLLPGIDVMVTVLFFGLFAMSFDFISGYTGYLSFGHAAFYGVGAYFVVFVANDKVPLLAPSTPFVFSLVLAGLLAAVLAVLIGAVSFRLTGVYFAMITLGFSQVIFVLMSNWDYVGQNPRSGTAVDTSLHPEGFEVGVPYVDALNLQIASANFVGETVSMTLLGQVVELSAPEVSYFMVGIVVAVCYFAMQRILHSPFGRVMIAIRENEERARAVGYDTFKYKMLAFLISAFFAAVAGGLSSGYTGSVDPTTSLFFLVAGDALLAAIIGGFGTLAGALFGYLFFETLREFLSNNVVSRGGASVPDGILPYLERAIAGSDLLGEGTLGTTLFGDVTVRTVLDVLLNGRAELYIGILFVLFVLYVPNGILGTLRLWLGGTVARRLPERVGARLRGLARSPGGSAGD